LKTLPLVSLQDQIIQNVLHSPLPNSCFSTQNTCLHVFMQRKQTIKARGGKKKSLLRKHTWAALLGAITEFLELAGRDFLFQISIHRPSPIQKLPNNHISSSMAVSHKTILKTRTMNFQHQQPPNYQNLS